MFLRSHGQKKAGNVKRQRDKDDAASMPPKKSRVIHNHLPRLPDYLVNRKNSDQLRTLFANESNPQIAKEMMEIVEKCQAQQFKLDYLHDWLAIYQFLRDPQQVIPYLNRLEDELQQYVEVARKRRTFIVTADGRWALPDDKCNPYERLKILSGFMYEWASRQGFERKAKLTSLLMRPEFLSMLRAKTIFKDSSVSANIKHGAWSHAIQWFCIVEHDKDSTFLMYPPMSVLQSFGDAKQDLTGGSLTLAWDLVVDRFGEVFFTSPPKITSFLTDPANAGKWPLLTESVLRQENKSSFKYGSYKAYTKYLAKKHADDWVGCDNIIIKKL